MSNGLETYFQATYSDGFITIGQDLTVLTRSLLVASTLGGDMLARYELKPQTPKTAGERSNDFDKQMPLTLRPSSHDDIGTDNQGDWDVICQGCLD